MKKLILILSLIAISQSMVFSQGCLPEGINFTTQEQIDNFQLNYPGCTEIEGFVFVYGNNITNLYGLNVITYMWDSLVIDNTSLSNLTGLENLISIENDFLIKHNNGLTSFIGLENLTSIGSDFQFFTNIELTSLEGLEKLTTIGDNLRIGSYVTGNPSLTTLSGLNGLTSIGGHLIISGNSSLINLTGLEGLTSIGGSLAIGSNGTGNPALTTLTGLDGLTFIGGGLYIIYNEALISLTGLGSLQANSLTDLYIYSNSNLEECDVYSICQYLAVPNGNIEIHDNAPGCNGLEEVEAACLTSIEENPAIEGLSIFPNPATSFITINIKEGIPIEEAIIYNYLGQKVLLAVPVDNTVDVSTLTPGIYFLEVITSESRTGTKLVIE